MRWLTWLSWFRRVRRQPQRVPGRRFRPRLEVLEGRQLPTTFTVVLASDSGTTNAGQKETATSGDLRYCIAQADARPKGTSNAIVFSPKVFDTPLTINLNPTLDGLILNDSNALRIQGPAGGQYGPLLTVSGQFPDVLLNIGGGKDHVAISNLAMTHAAYGILIGSGTVSLTNCTLSNMSGSVGAGILNFFGTVVMLTNCTISNNVTTTAGAGVYNSGTMMLTNCALSNNRAINSGGGIFNDMGATLTLTGCTLSNNTADQSAGGGIFNRGTVTLTNCTLSNNSANVGGGIVNVGTVTLTSCTFSNNVANDGGAIGNGGIITLTSCTLSSNAATDSGGGINSSFGTVTLTSCTLSNNAAKGDGGAIATSGTVTLTNCTLSNNSARYGGGIENASGGTATLSNCTLGNNSAISSGGGIFNASGGTVTLTNSTLSNNASTDGGGIVNVGTVTLINCTLGYNAATSTGGGLDNGGTLNLTNSLVADNSAATGPDIDGPVSTPDSNLIGNGSGSSDISNGTGGNLVGGNGNPVLDPRLGPLQDNGGPTQTEALLPSSPAIGKADNLKAPPTDQRGHPRNLKKPTDIGAFET